MPKNLPQVRITRATTAGPCGVSDAWKALTPSLSEMRPMPDACRRALTAPPAAIPTSAQGPHSTDDANMPRNRRHAPSESRQPLAAA
eukprot:scaffold36275_cov154-Isochrysis_galbana.AAC.39